jgi:putative FmdB family regulatory protein
MPIYAFDCRMCGPFDVVRGMVDASLPAACPSCGEESRRVYTPPGLALMPGPLRRARDHEEKSAHEPDVVAERRGRPMPHRHAHGHGPAMPWVMSH